MEPWLFWTLITFFAGAMIGGGAWAWADHKWIGVLVFIVSTIGLIVIVCYRFYPKIKNVRLRKPWIVLPDDARLKPGLFIDRERFYSPAAVSGWPQLERSLYVGDIRFTIDNIKKDHHTELSMRVFNGSGCVVEIGSVSGQIKFNAPNGADPNRKGDLPTPALRSDVKRTIVQLEERLLIFNQHVPESEANKLATMLKAKIPIHFDLRGLKIEVFPDEERAKVERLRLWDGVTSERGYEFGRIITMIGQTSK